MPRIHTISVLNKRYLLPLKLAILCGGVAGIGQSVDVINHYAFLHYHLYNTTARLLATNIDTQILIYAAALYSGWIAYLIGTKLHDFARSVWYIATLVLVLGVALLNIKPMTWIHELDASLFQDLYRNSLPQIFAATVCILLSMSILLILRKSGSEENNRKDMVAPLSSSINWARMVLHKVERQSIVFGGLSCLLIGLNLAAVILWISTTVQNYSRPNVVMIMVDSLRADHLGCYGYSRSTSPNIDRFAKECILFRNASSNSSWTTPSVSSFMSSQYPQTTLLYGSNDPLAAVGQPYLTISPRCVTIAEALRNQGYETAAIASNSQYSLDRRADVGFELFKQVGRDDVAANTCRWITTNKANRFFLFSLFLGPHSPYQSRPGFSFDPGYEGPYSDTVDVTANNTVATAPCSVEHMKALYDSNIAYTDNQIGLILDRLKREGIYDSSLIIVLSDHGEEFADHGKFFHGNTLYREMLWVPLLIKLPHERKSRIVEKPFSLINLFPTILSILKSNPMSIMPQGKALDLNKQRESKDERVFAVTDLGGVPLRSVAYRNYKCVLDIQTNRAKLFDTGVDPQEKHDITADHPRVVTALKKVIRSKEEEIRSNVSFTSGIPAKPMPCKEKNKLRSLGYLQ